MDKRLSAKFESYITSFKDDIKNELIKMNIFENNKELLGEFLSYLYEYERMEINRGDFMKRKRVKNTIPENNRCNAKKAGGEQCTRRRKENCLYCGTHVKGAPHGEVTDILESNTTKQIEIIAKEVNGIIYYIDKFNNIYKMEDILSEKENPQVVGVYKNITDETNNNLTTDEIVITLH
jgi:hypothetical protein|tara:strand:- start:208 stop:744 length:537 start_codon:yes stop_codon:yes gene_type:complete